MSDNIIETLNKLSERLNAIAGDKPNILIIDDDKFYCELLSKWFHEMGFFVDIANDGVNGLEKLMHNRFDMIWLDVRMPNMDGGQVLNHLTLKGLQYPIIIYSGYLKQGDDIIFKKLGAIEVFKKPDNPKELEVLINQLKIKK